MKKLLLTLGSVAAVVVPVVSVVACSSDKAPAKTSAENPTTASPTNPIITIDNSGPIESVTIDTGDRPEGTTSVKPKEVVTEPVSPAQPVTWSELKAEQDKMNALAASPILSAPKASTSLKPFTLDKAAKFGLTTFSPDPSFTYTYVNTTAKCWILVASKVDPSIAMTSYSGTVDPIPFVFGTPIDTTKVITQKDVDTEQELINSLTSYGFEFINAQPAAVTTPRAFTRDLAELYNIPDFNAKPGYSYTYTSDTDYIKISVSYEDITSSIAPKALQYIYWASK